MVMICIFPVTTEVGHFFIYFIYFHIFPGNLDILFFFLQRPCTSILPIYLLGCLLFSFHFTISYFDHNPSGIYFSIWCESRVKYHFVLQGYPIDRAPFYFLLQCRVFHHSGVIRMEVCFWTLFCWSMKSIFEPVSYCFNCSSFMTVLLTLQYKFSSFVLLHYKRLELLTDI